MMRIFNKLFGSSKSKAETGTPGKSTGQTSKTIQKQQQRHESSAQSILPTEKIPEEELISIFATYFSPNTAFYSSPGSAQFTAYFNAINKARNELLENPEVLEKATKWTREMLVQMINNPIPGISNMVVCGLIFHVGAFAVNEDYELYYDFPDKDLPYKIPYCIALYLLLTAQKIPADERLQMIMVRKGVNTLPLSRAMCSLQTCDHSWNFMFSR